MHETKLTAHLPSVDVEIIRHSLPDENAEALTIRLRAVPSFESVAQWLSFDVFAPAGMAVMWTMLWGDAIRASWLPWQWWLSANPLLTGTSSGRGK
jgi:hypothetical protein